VILLTLLAQQELLPIRERLSIPLLYNLETFDADHSKLSDCDFSDAVSIIDGASNRGIASFVTPDGTPQPLSHQYQAAALLASKKSRSISDEVYDASVRLQQCTGVKDYDSPSGREDRTDKSTSKDHSTIEAPVPKDETGQGTDGPMTATEEVLAMHQLVELILLQCRPDGDMGSIAKLQGVNRSFRHVLKRSTKLRGHVFGKRLW
jgi:hypothetical protein